MSTTDDEADLFFQRGARPGLHGTTGAAESSSGSGDSSSDIEVVGHSSAAKPTPKNNAKGKQKAIASAGPSSRKGKGRLADSTTAGSSSTARKTRRTSVRISSSSSDSSSDEHRAPTSGQGLPFTSTQLVRDGAGLRARAREKGWQGSTPPPRAKRTTAAATRKETAVEDDSDSDLSDLGGPRRRVSTSTDQTTVSDRSSSSLTKRKGDAAATATKAPTRKRVAATSTKAKETSAPKPRKRRTSRIATMSPSPDPDLQLDPALQPPPPQSFWGVDASASTSSAAAAKKHKHGEATNRLKSLSERAKMLVLPEEEDVMDQDEIDLADSGSSSAGEPEKYELAAAKAKRQKAEALERLKAKRGRTSAEPPPRNSTPRADSLDLAAPDKGKQKAVAGPATQACPVCAERIPFADLERHANDCLDFTGMDDFQPTAAQPQAGPSHAPPAKSAFRPAGAAATAAASTTSSTVARSTTAKQDNLAAALFPSSPAGQRPPRSAASNARPQLAGGGRARDRDFDDEVVAISPAKKGKGRAVDPQLDGYISSSDDLYETGYAEAGAAARRSFIEIRDDDDDVIVQDGGGNGNRRTGGSSRRTDGREGPINSEFRAGPPDDGSSPPKASLYISTMSNAFREGYQRMYARPEPKAKKARTSTGSMSSNGARQYDPDLSDSEARAFDDLAPGPSRRSGGSGRGRGGGGGGKRGGGRKGSWSWKRGRGRGAKKS